MKHNKPEKATRNTYLIFFDGQCNLCDRFVNFIFKRDFKRQFLYAPLQGQTAKQCLEKGDIKNLKSIIFLKNGMILKETRAIQAIFKQLYPRWSLVISVLPPWFFNLFYRFIAKRRYGFFGKKSALYQPSRDQKRYFLH